MTRSSWVIKLGGSSLQQPQLRQILHNISKHACLIVPGGGVFADQVRSEQAKHGLSDVAAHWMSILAMQQTGMLMADLCPAIPMAESLIMAQAQVSSGRPCIWLPAISEMRKAAGIHMNWQYTSDSIALWVCQQLTIPSRLLLVKSCSLKRLPRTVSVKTIQQQGMIDEGFSSLLTKGGCQVWIASLLEHQDWIPVLASPETQKNIHTLRESLPLS
ncbi:MAG: hypothetical protein RIQ52_860 [Pseudomonadota bacterium]|jgi:aspartokinase-like uncharacterized kinase